MMNKKMNNEMLDYGNWVPKKMLIAFLMLTLLFGGLTFLPVHIIVRVVFGILSVVFLLFLLYFYYSYHVFSVNGGAFQKTILNVVVDKLVWDGQGNTLDIGTGAGTLAIGVAKKYPNAKVTGIDYWGKGWSYSQRMCEKNAAIERVGERTNFQKASAASLPFNDGEFDAAVSNFVFHEVKDAKDKRDVIRKALRVVRKGGAFSFQDLFLKLFVNGELKKCILLIRRIWLRFHDCFAFLGCLERSESFMEKSEDIVPSLALFSNSGYEATAFGFRPNSRFARTSHIRRYMKLQARPKR